MLRSPPVQERCDKEGGDDREIGEVDVKTRVRQRNELATDEYDGCKAAQREQGPSRDRGHTWMVRHPGLPAYGFPAERRRLAYLAKAAACSTLQVNDEPLLVAQVPAPARP